MTRRLLASFFLLIAALTISAQEPRPQTSQDKQTEARGILKSFYSSSNPAKREMVVSVLSVAARDRGVADMLTGALSHDKDPKIRTLAASAMAEGKCRSCIPVLRTMLDDADIVVAFSSAKALWDMGDRSGLPLFEEVLSGSQKDSEGIVHGAMLKAHRTLHDPSALALLSVNEVTGIFFGPAGTALSYAEQGRKMSGGTAGRVVAARFVGEENSAAARRLLEEMLSDKDGAVVAASCKALAIHDDRASLPEIEPLLDDARDIVQVMSAAAVIRLTEANPAPPGQARRKR
ncbi:MAG TPA: HEAT repeat domain-containing protein [Bryobacteraceae bacterium]|jgi:HEAT repeat protein|nr:HEAT repeat domain-containing protein [Bryobacteraceae bacterium]